MSGLSSLLRGDRSVRKELCLFPGATAALALSGLLLGWQASVAALITGLLLTGLHLAFVLRRRKELAALSEALDRVLHGQEALPLAQDEGELAVLQSEIRKLTVRLREAADALQQDKLRLSEALADISHQLRTPLTAMNLTVSLLSERDLPEDRRLALTRELRGSLGRVDWLVETLLKLSRIDAGTVRFTPQAVPVRALIDRAVEELLVPMELRGIALVIEAGDEALSCDLAWTAEALGNVVKNCMEHTPSGGTVTVRAEKTPIYTELTVRDTGPGIDEADLPHLFERFYRGKNADARSVGIGLAFARSVLAAQNATIKAANAETGAVFTIRFYSEVV